MLDPIAARVAALLKRSADASRYAKFVLIGLGLLALVGWGLFLNYYMPSYSVVQITDTDVKRMDDNNDIVTSKNPATMAGTRDVWFIMANDNDSRALIFRNEDTGWGFPWYFKFDSGDLTAEATRIRTRTPDAWVRVTHYGWRIHILSMFPNAVSIKVVDGPDHVTIPWFNIVTLLLLHGVPGYGVWRLVRRVRRGRDGSEAAVAG